MKTITVSILLLLLQSCAVNKSSTNKIELIEGNQLNSFYKAGTTTQLRKVYKSYVLDKKRTLTLDEIHSIEDVLSQSATKKHRQKKIVGIYTALEVYSDDKIFCLLLTEEIVFDILNNIEYSISKQQSLYLKNMFELAKKIR